jgi:predicted house-cleaning noncanonical NTP pyrophosphatase (MazG superfamily)
MKHKYIHTELPIENRPKLVRDLIPEIIEKSDGVKAVTKTLDDAEYITSLVEKIHEEAEELALALRDKTNPTEELADLSELLNAVAIFIGSSPDKVERVRVDKFKRRGGFSKRIMLLGEEAE